MHQFGYREAVQRLKELSTPWLGERMSDFERINQFILAAAPIIQHYHSAQDWEQKQAMHISHAYMVKLHWKPL